MFICPQCAASYPDPGFCGSDGTKLELPGDDALIGTMVGVYRIAALIGVGGWGRVYKGVHPEIGSRVAIKVLSHDCSSKPELIKRFFNEARAVNLIRHESIVNIIDLAQLPDRRPYIVMEYLDGLSLAKHIKNQGMLGISETCRICAEVLDALSVAHEKGIIHRDLKPDNLFLSPEGRAKVLDFGIAKLHEEDVGDHAQTRAGSILGTPHFMSPEQALARPVDARSDIYSMGIILFQCLTGRLPFEANSVLELARAHTEQPPVSPKALRPDIPDALDALVLRALAKDPADRWPDAATLSVALRKLSVKHPGERTRTLASEPAPQATIGASQSSVAIDTRSYEPEAPEAAPSGSGAKRGIMMALALLLLGGAAIGVALVLGGGSDDDKAANGNSSEALASEEVPAASTASEGLEGTTNAAGEEIAAEVANPQPDPPLGNEPIPVAAPSEACVSPDNHCLPDDLKFFATMELWRKDQAHVYLADRLSKPDSAGEAKFYLRREKREIVTRISLETHRARREELAAGRMVIFFKSRLGDQLYLPPETQANAIAGHWRHARIVSIDGMRSGNYVLVSDGDRVDASALRIVEGDKSDAVLAMGPVDDHFLRSNHWMVSEGPIDEDKRERVSVGLAMKAPSSATNNEGQFLLTDTGEQLWSKHAWRTRPATKSDLKVGMRVFFPYVKRSAAYEAPSTRSIALSERWWTGRITDTSQLFKGQVKVDKNLLVDAKAMRVTIGSVVPAPTPTSGGRATPAPAAQKQFPISGGLTPKTAELVLLGKAIEGVADDGKNRYYKFEVVEGQSETFTIYSERTQQEMGGSNMTVTLLASDGEKLGGEMTATYATARSPEFDKDEFSVTFKKSATVQLVISCNCALSSVHYRIMTAER